MTDPSWFTGPRVTLQIASLIVLGAAYYSYRTLNWRIAEADGTSLVPAEPCIGETDGD